ncbi:VWA domain-containing protein [Neolewinella lacunae]|uniref:VWA domain-containing protein n=1 Tax=Neolewinella lacunae TaxID=1517758 RepID=A0A923PLR5_9BACT|nr:VWA domain-containing protein [Neolewinella lacunae]MBC6994760.1 VWA domain-containing protein [Neolewinella lacunae]MDN3634382.1 VWA domain-containing protein [Neolewinella lacunae]
MMETQDPHDYLRKWRLILGQQSDPDGAAGIPLPDRLAGIDNTLEALYANQDRKAGLGSSSPNVNRWLGDIRKYFPTDTVHLLQRDALERLGLQRMLLEPELLETIEPDVHLIGTLLSLKNLLPERSRESARAVVLRVVRQIEALLKRPVEQAIGGRRRQHNRNRKPRHADIDWHQTIRANLRHYQPEYKTVLPVHLRGQARANAGLKHVILLIDQSGSMAASVVYAGVLSCILASIPSLRTQVVCFDTSVVNLTHELPDPLELLFAIQLGGGTDIGRALRYAETLNTNPRDTVLILLSDLFEGGSVEAMLASVRRLQQSGLTFLPLLALNDEGAPAYDRTVAAQLTELGLQPFASTPGAFAEVLARALYR